MILVRWVQIEKKTATKNVIENHAIFVCKRKKINLDSI
jgi:hypothetical protein